jgi:polyisoprenoid-binding protein YceI
MKTKRLLVLLLTGVLAMQAGTGGPAELPATIQSSVRFSIRNAGLEVHGTIAGIEADISFHPDDLARSHMTATANPATLQTGISLRDKHLQRPDYFDVNKHPC